MKLVGLTGGIGSGKSTVARYFRELGVTTLDADQLARDAVLRGSPALAKVAAAFGDEVLNDDGTLNRAALAEVVFRHATARKRLNAIVHPEVRRLFHAEVERLREAGSKLVLYEVPLLFENNLEQQFDATIVVASSPETQRQRVQARDGLDAEEAQRRIDAQLPLQDKLARASHILWNDQGYEALAARVKALLKVLMEVT